LVLPLRPERGVVDAQRAGVREERGDARRAEEVLGRRWLALVSRLVVAVAGAPGALAVRVVPAPCDEQGQTHEERPPGMSDDPLAHGLQDTNPRALGPPFPRVVGRPRGR